MEDGVGFLTNSILVLYPLMANKVKLLPAYVQKLI